ncbi:MAG: preprotein translocase subunit SecG [Anaeroplasmataceae bacterium]
MGFIDVCIILSAFCLIVLVMLQDSKDDIKDAFNGTKQELFKNQKTRGIDLVLQRGTAIVAILFFVLVMVAGVMSKSQM